MDMGLVLRGYRLSTAGRQRDDTGTGGSKHAAKRAPRPSPEGCCIADKVSLVVRGTPGIVSRSRPTVWARYVFSGIMSPARPEPAYRG